MIRVLGINTQRGWRGGENQCYLLQRGLAEAQPGIRYQTLCRADEPLARRLVAERLDCTPVAMRSSNDPRAVARLRRLARSADVIHAHTGQAHSLALLAAAGSDRPVVVTRRVDFVPRPGLKYGPRVRRFVAISRAIAAILARAGIPRRRITIIPSGVDPARFAVAPADLEREFDVPAGVPVVIAVGALVPHKGHRHLLEAWATLEREALPGALIVVGSGPLEGELHAQAHRLGLAHVHFAGQRADVPQLMRAADLFVMPSVEEGLGTAIMDARCCGLPVVASRAGGIPELVADDVDGLLTPVADPAALAAALRRVLVTPRLRKRLAAASAARAEQHHYRGMVAAYADLYRELTGSQEHR